MLNLFSKKNGQEEAKETKILEDEILKLKVQNQSLKIKNESLEKRLVSLEGHKYLVDVNIGDPAPSKPVDRKVYVAAVAGLYKDHLHPKFMQMISTAHALLEPFENDREKDLLLKGVVFTLWDLDKWGERMVNEHLANLEDQSSRQSNLIPNNEN